MISQVVSNFKIYSVENEVLVFVQKGPLVELLDAPVESFGDVGDCAVGDFGVQKL